ncbi:MAG: 3,4-dihydroxy-2-butanone-4-phosphate synthase [Rhodospirillaceae bacterium]|nr:3,4-dihydroxy-2-butanone-4-phosphate synthase [Rhodospirillaceae bacterium]
MPYRKKLSSIEDIIEDARNGRMFVLVDDEDRENEGDLVIPAQMATPEVVNFMAKYGRGLICLTLSSKRVRELDIPPMAKNNDSRHSTAFTVSIEAREGISTGISASDRARTIAVATDPSNGKEDIVSPGHVFPLEARDGGVLVRAGHTEAAVDVARLAGLNPSGVICEIMNEDGTMARMPDLIPFAEKHGLKIATIADLIAFRLKHDHLVERQTESDFNSVYGDGFKKITYKSYPDELVHTALIKGDISSGGTVLVRMHAIDVASDVLGDANSGKAGVLAGSIKAISDEGRGAVVVLQPGGYKMTSADNAEDKAGAASEQLRSYGVGAQILMDLGIHEMELLSNTERTIVGLEGYGLKVTGRRAIPEST